MFSKDCISHDSLFDYPPHSSTEDHRRQRLINASCRSNDIKAAADRHKAELTVSKECQADEVLLEWEHQAEARAPVEVFSHPDPEVFFRVERLRGFGTNLFE